MTQDTFKAWRKAYQAGARYSRSKAWFERDESAHDVAKAKYGDDEQMCSMFVAGVYDTERKDFYRENPDYTGNGWE